jgi:hypothetical protein
MDYSSGRSEHAVESATVAQSFEDGQYATKLLGVGTNLYRTESAGQGMGRFLGLVKPNSPEEAETLYNLLKRGNKTDVVPTYRVTTKLAVYFGKVAGGEGMQILLPKCADLVPTPSGWDTSRSNRAGRPAVRAG